MISFHANCVSVMDIKDFWLVGFADEEFDTRHYVMLQRSYQDDAQDLALGMNTYHVERDGQNNAGYGGVERFDLYPDRIVIKFDRMGAKRLKTPGVSISFKKDGRRFGKLQSRLANIFAGTDRLFVHP